MPAACARTRHRCGLCSANQPPVLCLPPQMLLALVPAGSHIVTTTDCYFGTRNFIQTVRGTLKYTGGFASRGI